MQVTVNEKSKIVEMWLTKAERDNAQFRENLKPLYAASSRRDIVWLCSCQAMGICMRGPEICFSTTEEDLLHKRYCITSAIRNSRGHLI